ncbi:MAG: VIT1/CCC1 transporter family protein [Cyanobium sp. MAG06]|nr:VIT1/CCC1 transporter family protein [Cyanobium sp. MAG06]
MEQKIKKYLPSMVYGGSDGAVSYFALMAGGYGAGIPLSIMISIGVSNVVADALSMASANYLSEESKVKENKYQSIRNAFVTFLSFVTIGLFPIMPSIYSYFISGSNEKISLVTFIFSIILTMLAFVFIGYIRGQILHKNKLKMITQSVVICTLSSIFAYYIGEYLSNVLI